MVLRPVVAVVPEAMVEVGIQADQEDVIHLKETLLIHRIGHPVTLGEVPLEETDARLEETVRLEEAAEAVAAVAAVEEVVIHGIQTAQTPNTGSH